VRSGWRSESAAERPDKNVITGKQDLSNDSDVERPLAYKWDVIGDSPFRFFQLNDYRKIVQVSTAVPPKLGYIAISELGVRTFLHFGTINFAVQLEFVFSARSNPRC
jgi:hypothetical protein